MPFVKHGCQLVKLIVYPDVLHSFVYLFFKKITILFVPMSKYRRREPVQLYMTSSIFICHFDGLSFLGIFLSPRAYPVIHMNCAGAALKKLETEKGIVVRFVIGRRSIFLYPDF